MRYITKKGWMYLIKTEPHLTLYCVLPWISTFDHLLSLRDELWTEPEYCLTHFVTISKEERFIFFQYVKARAHDSCALGNTKQVVLKFPWRAWSFCWLLVMNVTGSLTTKFFITTAVVIVTNICIAGSAWPSISVWEFESTNSY